MNSQRLQLIRIEALVLFGIAALFLLLVLGSYRRRSSHKAVKFIVWGAYAISYFLVGYTIGLMESFPLGNILFSVWTLCLALILGSVDSLSAYSLDDNDNWKRFYAQNLFYYGSVGWLLAAYGTYGAHPNLQGPLWAIYAIAVLSFVTRTTSFEAASKSYGLSDSTKCVADYMSYEHVLEDAPVPNPITMHGYRYVVAGEDSQKYIFFEEPPDYLIKYKADAINKLVTVEEIWQCSGRLLRSDSQSQEGQRLKDICLSMALSKMLNRRYAGLYLSESKLQKTHDFVFQGLLSGDMGYERVFRVIEVELGFVHDFFYTKYYALYALHPFLGFLAALSSPFCLWLAYQLFGHFHTRNDTLAVVRSNHRNYDALVTMVIVVGIAMLELLQLYFYIASDWCKVYLISKYVKKPTWQSNEKLEKIIAFVVTKMKTFPFRYWENMIGQYSLLHNFNYRSTNVLYRLTFGLVDKTEKGRKEGKSIDLPNEVRKAVINSFVRSSGRLTNGITSLNANQVEQLLWTCNDVPTLTHTILIWHIATTLCEHKLNGGGDGRQPSAEMKTHALVASSLSKYCAYLVAFAPNLLPDHSFDSATIFDALVDEASELLEATMSMQEKYRTLMIMTTRPDEVEKRIIVMGARLGMQLTGGITDPRLRWKVLHDFWAEMMLYIAPSDDIRAHLETLTRGGEFITHLWALLTHAGILERDDSAGTP